MRKNILATIMILTYSLSANSQEGKKEIKLEGLKPISISEIAKRYPNNNEGTGSNSSSGNEIQINKNYNQTPDSLVSKIKYEKSIESKYAKDVLWSDANTWISAAFKNSKAVIDLKDKDLGRLIIKGSAILPIPELYSVEKGFTKFTYNFTIQIDCKDNKYRYIISSRSVTNTPMRGENPKYLSSESLKTIVGQLEDIVEITNNSFGGSVIWEINNKWNPILNWQLNYNFTLKDLLVKCCIVEKELINSLTDSMLVKDEW